jgi:hypothetical protein
VKGININLSAAFGTAANSIFTKYFIRFKLKSPLILDEYPETFLPDFLSLSFFHFQKKKYTQTKLIKFLPNPVTTIKPEHISLFFDTTINPENIHS